MREVYSATHEEFCAHADCVDTAEMIQIGEDVVDVDADDTTPGAVADWATIHAHHVSDGAAS